MKTMKTLSKLMLMMMVVTIIAACSKDSDDEDSLPFTADILVDATAYWDIKDMTGSNAHFYKGAIAEFYADGTCKGFDSMETAYKITKGKVHTYYAKTDEPMFVYTLLSRKTDANNDELTVRVNGTLDDKSSVTIIMRKNSKAANVK